MTATYFEIGKLLRSGREGLRLTPLQVAQALHIRVRYIDALEKGEMADMPAPAYAKGYLQRYAAYIGLDCDEILRQFDQAEGGLSKKHFYIPDVIRKDPLPPPQIIWGALAFFILFYLAWLAFGKPPRADISVIEPYTMQLSELPRGTKVACIESGDVLYPPCYGVMQFRPSLLPLTGRISSIMDLPWRDEPAEEPETNDE